MSPASVSMNVGQVVKITGITKNYAGNIITADVNYSSSNTSQITISPLGYICGGVWDANYINCNALPGQSGVATATITATSGTASATAPVFTHLQVDQISVNKPTGCVSVGGAPHYQATAYNTTAPGCSSAIPCDVTPTVGPITFNSTDLTVMVNNSSTGILTANEPGSTSIYATVAGLNSTPQPALVCPVVSINVHDAASSNTTFSLAPTGTQALVADVIDSAGVAIQPALAWSSIPAGVATISQGTSTSTNSATVTANTSGTAIVTVTCSTPTCNRNISPQYSQNVATVNVSGTTTTTVYAASTQSQMLLPISTSNNTGGTAITLPYAPNSIGSDSLGSNVYLGSANGLMTVNPTSSAVSVSASVPGVILAVSPSGAYILISDSVNNYVYLYNTTASKIIQSQNTTGTAAAFSPDNNSVTFLAPGNQLYYLTAYPTATFSTLPFTPDAVDLSAQGGMTYVTTTALGGIDILTTCNQTSWQTLVAANPTLVKHLPNGTGAVVADTPSLDVITTASIPTGCPPTALSTVISHNLGFGSFNASQMFISPDSSKAWVISDHPAILGLNLSTFAPISITLANSAVPLSGGIMIDGSTIYVGASDNNVHAINTATSTDAGQISTGLKTPGGAITPPNLVLVLPK